jgi:hypothetical protein
MSFMLSVTVKFFVLSFIMLNIVASVNRPKKRSIKTRYKARRVNEPQL